MEDLNIISYQSNTWEKYFAALKRYKDGKGNGDPNCPVGYSTDTKPPLKLGKWLYNQRQAIMGKRKISKEQAHRLEELGVWLKNPNKRWEQCFAALERYKNGDGNGNPNCPKIYVLREVSPPLKLGVWLSYQRSAKRDNKISREQIRRLEELGVWWDKKKQKGDNPS